jgi:hypothetical protein
MVKDAKLLLQNDSGRKDAEGSQVLPDREDRKHLDDMKE